MQYSLPERFRGRVPTHVVLLEGLRIQTLAACYHCAWQASTSFHLIYTPLALHGHAHAAMSLLLGAATGVTRVLGCGARGSVAGGGEHKVLLKMTGTRWTLVLAVRILLRVAPWIVGASSRDVLLHHLSVWGSRA